VANKTLFIGVVSKNLGNLLCMDFCG